LLLRTTKQH